MLRKLIFACMIVAISCVSASAIEIPKNAQLNFDKPATAYTSRTFNKLLMEAGVDGLMPEAVATLPAGYASVSDGKAVFNYANMVYAPYQYHAILTAYGLELNAEEVASRLGNISYAKIKDGKVAFGKVSTAYNRSEWTKILGCYVIPVVIVEVVILDTDGDGVNDDVDACPGSPRGIKVDERGCWTHDAELLFAFDSSKIKTTYYSELDAAKQVFDAHPNMNVQIDGYTCNMGPAEYNQGLSVRRAEAVKNYLVNKAGVNANRLTVKGFGETDPAYPNDTITNREKNRRVQFTPMQ